MIAPASATKTGQRMGHMSVSGGAGGRSSVFERLDVRRKVFIHMNNTNPIARRDSPERAEAADAWLGDRG